MRSLLTAFTIGALAVVTGCGGADQQPPIDASPAGGACATLDEGACLARGDCHAGYQVDPCRNLLGYCATYQACAAGLADCLGPATCERVAPFCAGPYVTSYLGACYGPCVRADQCAGCRADKLAFTQATGCANDGSVELCIPPVLATAITTLAPTATCAVGTGRAGCDPATQLLCTIPTAGAACTAVHGALTDDAWATLCHLSMLPEVTAIVPTILE